MPRAAKSCINSQPAVFRTWSGRNVYQAALRPDPHAPPAQCLRQLALHDRRKPGYTGARLPDLVDGVRATRTAPNPRRARPDRG